MFEEYTNLVDNPLMKDLMVDLAMYCDSRTFDGSKYHDDFECLMEMANSYKNQERFFTNVRVGLMILCDRMDKQIKELQGQAAVDQAKAIVGGDHAD